NDNCDNYDDNYNNDSYNNCNSYDDYDNRNNYDDCDNCNNYDDYDVYDDTMLESMSQESYANTSCEKMSAPIASQAIPQPGDLTNIEGSHIRKRADDEINIVAMRRLEAIMQ
ncbi:21160_t:CDS:2, partial [Gigaspora margarita]